MNRFTEPGQVEAQREVDALVLRLFFTIALVGAGVATLIIAGHYEAFLAPWRLPMLGVPLLIVAAIAAAAWLARRGRHRLGVVLVLVAGYVAITTMPLASGLGLRSMMLAFNAPLIIVAGVMLGTPGALAFGAICGMTVFAIPDSRAVGVVGGIDATSSRTELLLINGTLVALSTMIGVQMSLALVRSLRAAKRQEHRFRQLLAIAADWYWEQDAQLRHTKIDAAFSGDDGARAATPPDERRPDGPELALTAAQWDAHQVNLQARLPIRDFVMRRPDSEGRQTFISISGEPVIDDRGVFRGYWGIGRNVTAEVDAHLRLEASEQLYRELFDRASTAFVLHRGGKVVRANAAAAKLFGYTAAAAAVGVDIFGHIAPSHRELVAQRVAALEREPIGAAAPSIVVPMRRRDGTAVDAQASMVRIAMADGAAHLSIITDITRRMEAERALASAKEQAEAASRSKSRFLANMSHEVRTPLNGIYGLAQLALADDLPAAQRRDYLRQIVDSAEHLSGLLSDVLDLSKIEAGELNLESIPFDLIALIESVAAAYRGLAEQKGLAFALDLRAGLPPRTRGDPTRTRQIVANFLSNALKFTSGGSITLRAMAAAQGTVRIEVHDTGIGIDAATCARLFTPFTQADESTTRRYGGSGLGLSICNELACLLGGRVGVDSVPGGGSRFWTELPLPAVEAGAMKAGNERGVKSAGSLDQVRLLIVEDNPVNMTIAMAMLDRWGARVTPANNGLQALEMFDAASTQFDAVLMDVHMPVMDGLDATCELRKRRTADELPIIAMTAAVLEEDLHQAYAAGVNDVVSKPFAADQLLATIERWTTGRRRGMATSAEA